MFSPHDFLSRVREKLGDGWADADFDPRMRPENGDHRLNQPLGEEEAGVVAARPAAVLAPIVLRGDRAFLLLTRRAANLRDHSGQIAFPGGKIEAGESPLAAALREAEEEIGLSPEKVEVLGCLDPYQTGTGFRVFPVLGMVRPPLDLTPDSTEVDDVFEAPLEFLMNPANHQRHKKMWQGRERQYFAMPWEDRYIWGATAGMIRNLYERVYG
jgi:8-oxo-dGTP pyrophosphatase MutT (NUDIX family)